MKIKYEFADGTVSEVEVEESIGAVIIEDRRLEDNLSRKERYHCYSLDAVQFEGAEYASEETPEAKMKREMDTERISQALDGLSEVQRRRLLMLADGKSMLREDEELVPMWDLIKNHKKPNNRNDYQTRMAPIYDTGASLWHDKFTLDKDMDYMYIGMDGMKPADQLKLFDDFSWFDSEKLKDFSERAKNVLSGNPLMSEKRIDAVMKGLEYNISYVENYIGK